MLPVAPKSTVPGPKALAELPLRMSRSRDAPKRQPEANKGRPQQGSGEPSRFWAGFSRIALVVESWLASGCSPAAAPCLERSGGCRGATNKSVTRAFLARLPVAAGAAVRWRDGARRVLAPRACLEPRRPPTPGLRPPHVLPPAPSGERFMCGCADMGSGLHGNSPVHSCRRWEFPRGRMWVGLCRCGLGTADAPVHWARGWRSLWGAIGVTSVPT